MAKYDITYECGHEATLELFGKGSQREWAIEKAEESLCPECKAQKYAAANNLEIVEMHYSEYKNNYASNKTIKNSYNSSTKTIRVYVEKEEEKVENNEEVKTTTTFTKEERQDFFLFVQAVTFEVQDLEYRGQVGKINGETMHEFLSNLKKYEKELLAKNALTNFEKYEPVFRNWAANIKESYLIWHKETIEKRDKEYEEKFRKEAQEKRDRVGKRVSAMGNWED